MRAELSAGQTSKQTPNTVVANVIDDSSVTMESMAYLRRESRDVSIVIYRCMASQDGLLIGQTNYKLIPPADTSVRFSKRDGVERRIRLPSNF
jgi:hypothetical protein